MQIPFFPPQQSEADFPEDVCAGLVRSALGATAGRPGFDDLSDMTPLPSPTTGLVQ